MRWTIIGLTFAAGWAGLAQAKDFGLPAPPQLNSGDVAWLGVASLAAVLAAAGAYRMHTAAQDFGTLALVLASAVLAWVAIGYSLAFGPGSSFIGDISRIFLGGLAEVAPGTALPESSVVLFELGLACVAMALLASAPAAADRPRRPVLFAALWLLAVYVPICHWIRSGGWLAGVGVLDFAGGLVAQLSAAVAVLVLGWTARTTTPAGVAPPEVMPGGLVFLLGSAGLIGGAGYAADDLAATALINAALAAAAGALALGGLDGLRGREPSTLSALTGAAAGITAVSASAGYIGTVGAMVTGGFGAIAAYGARRALAQRGFGGAPATIFALHGVAAAVGAMLLGVLAFPQLGGPGFEGPVTLPSQLAAQAIGIVVTALWSAVVTAALLWLLSLRRRRRRRS